MIRPLVIAAAALLSAAPLQSQNPRISGPLGATIDDYLTRMAAFGFAGAVAVEKDSVVILEKGYGLANIETRSAINTETLFDIGSIAKQFLATAVVKLESLGKLRYTDSISQHLPAVPADKRGITIHQLLSHSSGLPYQPGSGSPLALPLEFRPGSQYSYSNPGYTVLAMLVDRVAGEPYERFIERELFRPAGLTHTKFIDTLQAADSHAARGYIDGNDIGTAWDLPQGGPYRGAGGIASTPGDLVRWTHTLARGLIVDSARVAQLMSEKIRNPGELVGYAYGWMTASTIRGTPVAMHGGNYAAFNGDLRIYRTEGLVITLLSNQFVGGRSMRDAVMNGIGALINGGLAVAIPPAVVAASDAELRAIQGTYQLGDGGRISMTAVSGGLDVRGTDQGSMHHIFASGASDDARAFAANASASAQRVVTELLRGDTTTLYANLSPSIQRQNLGQYLDSLASGARAIAGDSASATAVGTALSGPQGGISSVRVRGNRGTTFVELTWANGQVMGITPATELPARRFLPTGANTYTAFNIFSGAKATITANGSTGTIVLADAGSGNSVAGRKTG